MIKCFRYSRNRASFSDDSAYVNAVENLHVISHKYKVSEVKSYYIILFNYFSIIINNYTRFFKVVERLFNYNIVDKNLIK